MRSSSVLTLVIATYESPLAKSRLPIFIMALSMVRPCALSMVQACAKTNGNCRRKNFLLFTFHVTSLVIIGNSLSLMYGPSYLSNSTRIYNGQDGDEVLAS